jgi:hypothetical protein
MPPKNDLTQAIQDADREFPGKKSSSPIMKFIASAESNYGNYNPETALSYGPFQIDPIRYYDIAQNPDRVNQPRIDKANEYLRTKLNNPDFDISKLGTYNPETKGYDDVNLEMMRNPDVGAVLTRLGLMQDPGDLPDEEGLGDYYESFWGPKWSQGDNEDEKAQKRTDAQGRYDKHHTSVNTAASQPIDDTMANYNKVENAYTKP